VTETRSPLVLGLASAIGLVAGSSFAQDTPLRLVPGSVVRWPGPGVTRCLRDGHDVSPVGGECLFAIDLLHAEGTVVLSRERGGSQESVRVGVLASPYPVERVTLPDDRYVKLKPRDLARVNREQKVVTQVLSRRTPPRFSFPLARPLAGEHEGRNFGRKRVLNGEERQPHGGVDYGVPGGTPVLAAEDGTVALVASQFLPGRLVILDHGGGLFSMYMHLSKTLVKAGSRVRRGDRIALSGATGRVSGPHLHFGVRWQEARVDPGPLFGAPGGWPSVGGR
jgi:murein DD-endopeptidase MepM/ murein hydrolase activator NlpD